MDIWQAQTMELDQCLRGQIGPLRLWLKRTCDELHIAVEHLPDSERTLEAKVITPVQDSEPENLDWSRWVIGESLGTVQLIPLTPNRAVVVRPEVPLSIPTNKEALFFVSFPIWVRVAIFTSKQMNLCEIPSMMLSNTWFGDPTYGELCYSLRRKCLSFTLPRQALHFYSALHTFADDLENRASKAAF